MPPEDYGAPRADAMHDFPDADGDVVRDDELLTGGEQDRMGAHRISQRAPRSQRLSSVGDVLVGRYEVEREMARTAHEVVLQARHLDLGQQVILRYLAADAAQSPEAIARFQRGARKAREMKSEHAERVIDFGRLDSGAPYRASELPSGPTLSEILRVRGPLPVAEAVDIVLAACEPVAEAHAFGVLHRALSTSNIYVERRQDGTPFVRVMDFGVSDPFAPDFRDEEGGVPPGASMVASLPYAAPEQIRSPESIDARTDVWAIGAILYELLAGAPLFQADTPMALLAMIAADLPTPLNMLRDDVPPELEALVLGCLEKDPDGRPRSVVDLVLFLSSFASVEARVAATRVERIIARTTRPPPIPGSLPPSYRYGYNRTSRASLVHLRPPPAPPKPRPAVEAPRGAGLAMMGAGIGLAAAAATVVFMRWSSPLAPAAMNVAPAAPVAVAAAPAAAPVAPVAVATAPVVPATAQAAPPVVAPAVATAAPLPAVVQAAPPPAVVQAAPVRRPVARQERATEDAPAPAKKASKAEPSDAPEKKSVASADALFSGMD